MYNLQHYPITLYTHKVLSHKHFLWPTGPSLHVYDFFPRGLMYMYSTEQKKFLYCFCCRAVHGMVNETLFTQLMKLLVVNVYKTMIFITRLITCNWPAPHESWNQIGLKDFIHTTHRSPSFKFHLWICPLLETWTLITYMYI